MATKQVNIDILANDKTAKAMRSATSNVNRLKDNVQKSVVNQQNSFNALGNTVRNVIGGVIVFQALRFSKEMVNMASAVEEMQSKSAVVFGQFVSSVRGQLEKFGDTVGRSTFELEQMASSIQDTFVPMGFARKEASQLSVQLTKLAIDVASFNNASDVETMMAFQSALVGNHETVRRFGVVITEATLKQELLRMGINKTATEVTNAEKVQARLNLIIAGTADAQGDAERTNTSFANSMKALNAEFQEFMVEAITPMLPALSKMIQSLKDSITQTKEFLRSIGLLSELNKVIPIVDSLKANSEALAEAEKKLAFEQEKLNSVQNAGTNILKLFSKENNKFGFGIMSGEKAIRQNIKALQDQIEKIKASRDVIMLESDSRQKVTNVMKNNTKEAENAKNVLKSLSGVSRDLTFSVDDMAIKFTKANDKITLIHSLDHFGKIKAQAQPLVTVLSDVERGLIDVAKSATDRMADSLTNLIKGTISVKDAFRDMANQIISDLIRMAIQKYITDQIFGFAVKAIAGAFGGPVVASGVEGGAVLGAMADGGRVAGSKPYLVGERGAEIFVPNTSGTIVPNHQIGMVSSNENMNKQVTVNFNITTVDATGFSELLVNSRATIVNVINQALNEKGKEVLV